MILGDIDELLLPPGSNDRLLWGLIVIKMKCYRGGWVVHDMHMQEIAR